MHHGKKSESHRIYWQRWINPMGENYDDDNSRRNLITSSAAIRISSQGVRAKDVTKLLRKTLKFETEENENNNNNESTLNDNEEKYTERNGTESACRDVLVLVGTLYSLPLNYVHFQHELDNLIYRQKQTIKQDQHKPQRYSQIQQQHQFLKQERSSSGGKSNNKNSSSNSGGSERNKNINISSSAASDPPYHIIKTLDPNDNPLSVRDKMMQDLNKKLKNNSSSSERIISPKIQWFFVPGESKYDDATFPRYIDLDDGYCTSLDSEIDDSSCDTESENEDDSFTSNEESCYNNYESCYDGHSDEEVAYHQEPIYEHHRHHQPECDYMDEVASEDDKKIKLIMSSGDKKSRVENRIAQKNHDQKQQQCYYQILRYQSILQYYRYVSGYLLKQSNIDPHVWRKVHCVLTDGYLLYASRVYYQGYENCSNSQKADKYQHCSKYRRIRLKDATLLKPSNSLNNNNSTGNKLKEKKPSFYRKPYSFQILSSGTNADCFRSTNRKVQLHWIEWISKIMIQSYENSLQDHAQMIIIDEAKAKYKRYHNLAIKPLEESLSVSQINISDNINDTIDNQSVSSPIENNLIDLRSIAPTISGILSIDENNCSRSECADDILSIGLQIANYREQCRHIHMVLPAKKKVVVVTTEKKQRSSLLLDNINNNYENDYVYQEELNPLVKHMISAAWDKATDLLIKSSQLAVQIQKKIRETSPAANGKSIGFDLSAAKATQSAMPRSLETLCRHIDYVITGSFRSFDNAQKLLQNSVLPCNSEGKSNSNLSIGKTDSVASIGANLEGNCISGYQKIQQKQNEPRRDGKCDPPPADLFDSLIKELQLFAGRKNLN